MPRQARMLSKTNIYHVMLRGNERRNIFLDEDDKNRFLDTVQIKLKFSDSKLYAFCLMDNHVHLLIGEGKEEIAKIMKRINVSYVKYFNLKYKRIGHLFQDRYKSETVEDEAYLLEAVRYIHNNPVKATMVEKAGEYKWSSYKNYLSSDCSMIEKETVLGMFSNNESKAKSLFEEFSEKDSEIQILEYIEKDEYEKQQEEKKKAEEILNDFMTRNNLDRDSCLKNKANRNAIVVELSEKGKYSIRKIAEYLRLNRGAVQNILKNHDNQNRPRCHASLTACVQS